MNRSAEQRSIHAYHQHVVEQDKEAVDPDRLGRQERIIYSIIDREEPVSRQQINQMTGDQFLQINAISGRVTALKDKGLVVCAGVVHGRGQLATNPQYRFPTRGDQ